MSSSRTVSLPKRITQTSIQMTLQPLSVSSSSRWHTRKHCCRVQGVRLNRSCHLPAYAVVAVPAHSACEPPRLHERLPHDQLMESSLTTGNGSAITMAKRRKRTSKMSGCGCHTQRVFTTWLDNGNERRRAWRDGQDRAHRAGSGQGRAAWFGASRSGRAQPCG